MFHRMIGMVNRASLEAYRARWERIQSDESGGVRVGILGPAGVGKTALEVAILRTCVGLPFGSGLMLLPDSIAAYNETVKRAQDTETESLTRPLVSTRGGIERWRLRLTDQRRLDLPVTFADIEGQLLTAWTSGATDDVRLRNRELLRYTAMADVLIITVPAQPPGSSPVGMREHRARVGSAAIHALAALDLRRRVSSRRLPVAVAVTQADLWGDHEHEVRSSVTAGDVGEWYRGLTGLLMAHELVGDLALIPVSAFGYGNTRPIDEPDPSTGNPASRIVGHATVDGVFRGDNIPTLVLWTLAMGLRSKLPRIGGQGARIRGIRAALEEDLGRDDGWIIAPRPLECRGKDSRPDEV